MKIILALKAEFSLEWLEVANRKVSEEAKKIKHSTIFQFMKHDTVVIIARGGTVVQWLELLPHSKKVGNPAVWSLHVSSRCSGFLSQFKDMWSSDLENLNCHRCAW